MTAPGRRVALALALAATLLLTACTPERAPDTAKPTPTPKVRTDREPLERRFAALGPLTDPHWLGTTLGPEPDPADRITVPGPSDVRVVGFARLKPGTVTTLLAAPHWSFHRTEPDEIPAALTPFTPEHARWFRSTSFDSSLTRDLYPGTFSLDPATDTVYFETMNPLVPPEPTPTP
ncbi:hypothetical protein GCM10027589_54620 [Actinocorallia lasiicapitis]